MKASSVKIADTKTRPKPEVAATTAENVYLAFMSTRKILATAKAHAKTR